MLPDGLQFVDLVERRVGDLVGLGEALRHAHEATALRAWLATLPGGWTDIQISDSMLRLGAQLGLGAFEACELATIDKFKAATQRLKSLQLPWSSALRWFGVAVSSVPQYLLQFKEPSSQLLLAESVALSSIAAIPHQSIPTACWRNLAGIGFGFMVKSLEVTSQASRCRVAMRSAKVLSMISEVADQHLDDESFIVHPFPLWVEKSCCKAIHENYHKLQRAGLTLLEPTSISLQAKITSWLLRDVLPDKLHEALHRRVHTVIYYEVSANSEAFFGR